MILGANIFYKDMSDVDMSQFIIIIPICALGEKKLYRQLEI